MKTEIIFEDKDILVAYKPAGLATQTARVGQQDMVSELKNYLWQKRMITGAALGRPAPYLGVIHRLDQPVEGLLVFALNAKAGAAAGAGTNGSAGVGTNGNAGAGTNGNAGVGTNGNAEAGTNRKAGAGRNGSTG